jgi:hypothetical protein
MARNRIKDPSINFPQSPEEAFQALLMQARRGLTDRLRREFTTDSGLGTTRTQQQADWLNEQQSLLRAQLEDFLDELDLEDTSH